MALLLILTGCQSQLHNNQQSTINNNQSNRPLPQSRLSTPQGLAEYLQDIPAVKQIQTWANPYAPGITITTEHYQIHTTLMEPLMLRQVPGFVESAYRAYQRQLPKPIETKTKFTTYLFATRQQWEEFTKTFTGSNASVHLQIKKGAYCYNGACVAYNIGRARTFNVLGHEGWHQFNSKHFTYRLPSWLDEGIAIHFETGKYDNGHFTFHPDRNVGRLGSLKMAIQTGKMIPLEKIIALNPGQVVHDSESAMGFYAQAYALVRFLREEGYGTRLNQFHEMLLGALNGTWPLDPELQRIASDRNIPLTIRWNSFISPKLFEIYIKDDMQILEDEYLTFCKKIVYRVRFKNEKR